jgi:aldehyde dehydrogenase (NAD+)
MAYTDILAANGLTDTEITGGTLAVHTPIDGAEIARLKMHSAEEVRTMIAKGVTAFQAWRTVPAPRRGELVRLFGEELRAEKENLGRLVTLECGKILQEGLGEVQEMIDICDFAVGLSRQLYGLTVASERPGHSMRETWHPMGLCGVITAFNFPVAPWAWNAAAGLWGPGDLEAFGKDPVVCAGNLEDLRESSGEVRRRARRIAAGRRERARWWRDPGGEPGSADHLGHRLYPHGARGGPKGGRTVRPHHSGARRQQRDDRGAVGRYGNGASRDRVLRRRHHRPALHLAPPPIVHEDVYDQLVPRLKTAYETLPIGDPLGDGTLVGPLIDGPAYDGMARGIEQAQAEGGTVHGGGRVLENQFPNAHYVRPAIVEMPGQTDIVRQETFAPILYAMKYRALSDAIAMHNDVPQGLSSCIFSTDVRETETFLSATGSDCGIANVNIGPSGAEIGGAFGGEKETGGGRESGSDAWKGYMRRQTNTVNYSRELPLAQGIKFEI